MGLPRPVVSILLPVHNARLFLEACLQSLLDQTFRDFEIVAVDDGSSDGSTELLQIWAGRDSRIRVQRQQRSGLVTALNRGLERCRGRFVARMDADDLAQARRLELQVQALEQDPQLDVVSCRVRHFASTTVGEGFRIYEQWLNGLVGHEDILRERFIESPLPHPSVMLRAELLRSVGGYEDRGWPEDYDLWLRLATRGARFRKVRKTLLFWREHSDRLTHSDPRYAVERFLECKAHYLAQGPLREVSRVILWGAGKTGRRLSKHLLRRGVPISAFIDIDPAKIGRSLRSRPIHPPQELKGLLGSNGKAVVLAAVASRSARQIIRRHLHSLHLQEATHFWCTA